MSARGRAEIAPGFANPALGKRANSQDSGPYFGTVEIGTASEKAVQGIVAVVADGAGAAKGGLIASELAVWSSRGHRFAEEADRVVCTADEVPRRHNLCSMASRGRTRRPPAHDDLHPAAALPGCILLDHPSCGDSCAGLRAASELSRTIIPVRAGACRAEDCCAPSASSQALRLDIKAQRLEAQDRLLLTTKGVHAFLSASELLRLLGQRGATAGRRRRDRRGRNRRPAATRMPPPS